MSRHFPRTIRDLQNDGPKRAFVTLAISALLAALWCAWMCLARVAIYRTSDRARLILGKSYEADAATAGRVTAIEAKIGQPVRAGQVLVELDFEGERRQLAEDRTRVAVIGPQISQINAAIDAEQRGAISDEQAFKTSLAQARVKCRAAVHTWHVLADIAHRYEEARDAEPRVAALRALQEAENAQAQAAASYLEIDRIAKDEAKEQSDRRAHIEQLRQNRVELIGEQQTANAEVGRLLYEIEKHRIQAPVDGRVAGLAPLGIGQFVREGDQIGSVVPRDKLKAVAYFVPANALGIIRPGQHAWLHLSAFPWTQYGSISATVANVAREPMLPAADKVTAPSSGTSNDLEQKLIRVELSVNPRSAPSIPLQYGLPGTADIEVDRVTPATLLMRVAGGILIKPTGSH